MSNYNTHTTEALHQLGRGNLILTIKALVNAMNALETQINSKCEDCGCKTERKVFTIDVGNLSSEKSKATLEETKQAFTDNPPRSFAIGGGVREEYTAPTDELEQHVSEITNDLTAEKAQVHLDKMTSRIKAAKPVVKRGRGRPPVKKK